MRIFLITLLVILTSTSYADGNKKQLEKAVKKEIEKELLDVNEKGKPSNPGAKGQANAAYKKATNPGKGSGKNNGVEGKLLDELIDDDKDKNKKNDKKKKK
jgi:hypothetical protein